MVENSVSLLALPTLPEVYENRGVQVVSENRIRTSDAQGVLGAAVPSLSTPAVVSESAAFLWGFSALLWA